jgi:hypothetical protein
MNASGGAYYSTNPGLPPAPPAPYSHQAKGRALRQSPQNI